MKILILGSWHDETAEAFRAETDLLGKLLAENNHTPIIAPGGGIYGAVGLSYRHHGGTHSVGFYPSEEARSAVNEQYIFEPDEKIMTESDYPTRNLLQTKDAEALIAIAGRTGTVTDFITGATDYALPSAYLLGSSKKMDLLMEFDGIKGNKNVYAGNAVRELLSFVENYTV